MNFLLDSNVLYWWLNEPDKISQAARDAIVDVANSVVVPAVVPWELAIKTNLGKLDAQTLLEMWDTKLASEGFSELPIQSAHAIRAGLLPRHHHDPFDRMLAAQAQATGWPIISADRVFDFYGVRRVW